MPKTLNLLAELYNSVLLGVRIAKKVIQLRIEVPECGMEIKFRAEIGVRGGHVEHTLQRVMTISLARRQANVNLA